MALHFVTGKGGVGKTRVSLLLAQQMPQSFLTEMTSGGLKEEASILKMEKVKILTFTKDSLFKKFIDETIRVPFLRQLIAKTSMAQTLLNLAPNLYELLLLSEWIDYGKTKDLIIDAPSAGNFLALIDCPRTAIDVFDGGTMRRIGDEIESFFTTESVYVHIVAIPENSALDEMAEIESKIQSKYPMFKIKKVLNRLHPITSPIAGLTKRLSELQVTRPQRERSRVATIKFDMNVSEGCSSL